jgi:hypothetical protein
MTNLVRRPTIEGRRSSCDWVRYQTRVSLRLPQGVLRFRTVETALRKGESGGLCASAQWKSTGFFNLGLKLLGCERHAKSYLTNINFRRVIGRPNSGLPRRAFVGTNPTDEPINLQLPRDSGAIRQIKGRSESPGFRIGRRARAPDCSLTCLRYGAYDAATTRGLSRWLVKSFPTTES